MKRLVCALALLLAAPAHALQVLCIEVYPSSFDPGPAADTAIRSDVAATGGKQGYTVYNFGQGTGGGGDPADPIAYFHFQYPANYIGNSFTPIVDMQSAGNDTSKKGCYIVGLTANTAGSVYANITAIEGTTQVGNASPAGTVGGTVMVTVPAVTVWDKNAGSSCAAASCAETTVVGILQRATSVCTSNDPNTEAVSDLHLCYTVP